MARLFIPLFLLLAASLSGQGDFTADADAFFKQYVRAGSVNYGAVKTNKATQALVDHIGATDPVILTGNAKKAYLINAYNILVIHQAVESYPLKSVLDQTGFFDGTKQNVGGKKMTLNELEKSVLLKEFPDPRLHFVLVCGALGCPPIVGFAYTAGKLEAQLDQQTKRALNNDNFIRVNGKDVGLSQIFEWYQADFGGSKASVIDFINGFRNEKLPADAKVSYYTYDWSINATAGIDATGANNSARYVVSSTIPRGTFEVKLFNNRYHQKAQGASSTFFTSTLQALYGAGDRFNVGINARYRTVTNTLAMEMDMSRSGLTAIGPQIRVAPFPALPNFSVQSSFTFPLGDDLTGGRGSDIYIDWDGPVSFTQFFNDFPIGNNFSLFAEIDLLVEDIGGDERLNRVSTPVTGIFSYFPTPKTTLYALAGYSPYWQEVYDYFYQAGAGAKYQFTPKFELELLATAFRNDFLRSAEGSASTLNLGVRFNI